MKTAYGVWGEYQVVDVKPGLEASRNDLSPKEPNNLIPWVIPSLYNIGKGESLKIIYFNQFCFLQGNWDLFTIAFLVSEGAEHKNQATLDSSWQQCSRAFPL